MWSDAAMNVLRKVLSPMLFCVCTFSQGFTQDSLNGESLRTYPVDSLNVLLLNELSAKKVVMFGDAAHGHLTFERSITSFLNYWLDEVQRTPPRERMPRRIILALEMNSTFAKVMTDYFRSGDQLPLLRYFVDNATRYRSGTSFGFSVDALQFYEELRHVFLRLDSLQRTEHSGPVSLQLLGPEVDPPITPQDRMNLSDTEFQEKQTMWFAHVRDVESSKNIIQALKENPDSRALVFYGTAHLVRRLIDKNIVGGAPSLGPVYDYYLAHHLDSLLGRRNVSVFGTDPRPSERMTGRIEEFDHNSVGPDFIPHIEPVPPGQFPFYVVNSQPVVRATMELAKEYHSANDPFNWMLAGSALFRIVLASKYSYRGLDSSICSEADSLIQEIRAQYRVQSISSDVLSRAERITSGIDPLKDITLIDSIMMLANSNKDRMMMQSFREVLWNLPRAAGSFWYSREDNRAINNYQFVPFNESERKVIKERRRDIQTYCLLQLLWIGNSDEKRRAFAELKHLTKMEFDRPQEWYDWWRAKYD